jgi:hypothetical protein
MGGVARRATVLFERRSAKKIPSITVETGNELKQSENLDEPVNRWVVEAFNALGVDFVNTTAGDLVRLNRLVQSGVVQPSSVRSHYIATMLRDGEKPLFPVKPYEIQKVTSSSGEEVTVGVLGLSSATPGMSESDDYEAVLRKILPEVERQSDLVIVNGSSTGEGREFPKAGNAVIVESARKGIGLGVLELEWDQKGHISTFKNAIVPLPPMIADQPALAAVVDKAKQEWARAEEEQIRKSPPPPADASSPFAGSAACKDCHEKAFQVWQKSGHARSFESLKGADRLDAACLRCHTTAYRFKGGFVNIVWTPGMAYVHCEACHGESADHAKDPTIFPGPKAVRGSGRVVGKEYCLRCHDLDNSPVFKYEDYWPKIAH